MIRDRSAKVSVRSHARPASGGRKEFIREYASALAALRRSKGDRHKHLGHDDLPSVRIARPAVKPESVKPQQIRDAVRKAVQEYSKRHSKALART